MTALLELAVGLSLLVLGGVWMVGGSTSLADRFRVPPLLVGITVLAFGTSAPELAVNLTASVRGSGDVAFGNVVGSNIANVGLILAIAALLRPLSIQRALLTRDMPMMALASSAALVMGISSIRAGSTASFDRVEGGGLLLLFGVFVYYAAADALRAQRTDSSNRGTEAGAGETGAEGKGSVGKGLALVVGGIAALAVGARSTVDGALAIADGAGIPDALVGLTIVAVGTSLPELSASVVAALRGQSELAVGNVVGSNIFNLLFVLGLSSVARPVPVPEGGAWDLGVMMGFVVLPFVFAATGRRISRGEGAVLLSGYVLFVAIRAG